MKAVSVCRSVVKASKSLVAQEIKAASALSFNAPAARFSTQTSFGKSRLVANLRASSIAAPRFFTTQGSGEIKVPSMGDSISEGTVVNILKKVGEYIKEDEVLMQLETDKVTVDVRSTVSGTITEVLAKESDVVLVGAPLAKVTLGPAPAGGAAPAAAPKAEAPKAEAPKAAAPAAEAPKPAAKPEAPKAPAAAAPVYSAGPSTGRTERRVRMTNIRKRTAQRLKDSQNTAAMLTTFNEIDMTNIMALRNQFKDEFEKKHGVKLGFMSAFVKAATVALQDQPAVNAVIDGDDIVYRDYVDISVAVASPSGLLVPVVRDCQLLNFAGVEKEIGRLSDKGRAGQISIDDMQGGTFTISNGGVFGSLFGTPIINPPQSAILGMHGIFKRPVAIGDKVEVRPMMYVALTYDHRLVDGREAVTFLRKVKDCVENPSRFILDL